MNEKNLLFLFESCERDFVQHLGCHNCSITAKPMYYNPVLLQFVNKICFKLITANPGYISGQEGSIGVRTHVPTIFVEPQVSQQIPYWSYVTSRTPWPQGKIDTF